MYDYNTEKSRLFTDEGQRLFLSIRDNVKAKLKVAGAVRCQEAMQNTIGTFDTWTALACIDRLIELGELVEIGQGRNCATQYRVYVAKE